MNSHIDKQEMKDYLLGTLDSDRRTQLEESILSDSDIYEELLVTEEELVDQYVAGRLSQLERQQFETHFLITSERQKSLRFGRLLKRYLNSQATVASREEPWITVRPAARKPMSSSWWPIGRVPSLAFSVAVVGLVGVIFLCWVLVRKSSLERAAQQTSTRVIVVALTPGSVRSGEAAMQRIQVPPKGYDVKLELQLTNLGFQNYKSELFRENQSLSVSDRLKWELIGERHIVPLTVAGDLLTPGDYQVRLSGVLDSGADEFIDNYSFRVIE